MATGGKGPRTEARGGRPASATEMGARPATTQTTGPAKHILQRPPPENTGPAKDRQLRVDTDD